MSERVENILKILTIQPNILDFICSFERIHNSGSPEVTNGYAMRLENIENIRIYRPHSTFMNDRVKMAQPIAKPIKISGGYCEIRNPDRRAMARKKIRRRCVRTITRLVRKK